MEAPCKATCLRSLDELMKEYKHRPVGNSNVQQTARIRRSEESSDKLPACVYDKCQLLQALSSFRNSSRSSSRNYLHYTAMPAQHLQCMQDPSLDDEERIVQLELREARESGADAKNFETFGESAAEGWSYEQAVSANNKLELGTACDSVWDSWDEQWSDDVLTPISGWDTWDGQQSEDTHTPSSGRSAAGDWLDYGCWEKANLEDALAKIERPYPEAKDSKRDNLHRFPDLKKCRARTNAIQASAWQHSAQMAAWQQSCCY